MHDFKVLGIISFYLKMQTKVISQWVMRYVYPQLSLFLTTSLPQLIGKCLNLKTHKQTSRQNC